MTNRISVGVVVVAIQASGIGNDKALSTDLSTFEEFQSPEQACHSSRAFVIRSSSNFRILHLILWCGRRYSILLPTVGNLSCFVPQRRGMQQIIYAQILSLTVL